MGSNKILLVEDIYFNQILIESMLVEWGYTVVIVENGSDALVKIQADTPDLIILDLMMPIMDGFKFLEEKKKLNPNIPVVVLSARSDMNSIKRAMDLGAKDFITKPFNSNDLENKIISYLK